MWTSVQVPPRVEAIQVTIGSDSAKYRPQQAWEKLVTVIGALLVSANPARLCEGRRFHRSWCTVDSLSLGGGGLARDSCLEKVVQVSCVIRRMGPFACQKKSPEDRQVPEAGGSGVPGWPGLHSKTSSQTNKQGFGLSIAWGAVALGSRGSSPLEWEGVGLLSMSVRKPGKGRCLPLYLACLVMECSAVGAGHGKVCQQTGCNCNSGGASPNTQEFPDPWRPEEGLELRPLQAPNHTYYLFKKTNT